MPLLTQQQAVDLIINYLEDNLPSNVNAKDNSYPNSSGGRSEDVNWLKVFVEWATSVPANAGRPILYRTPGILIVDVNVPVGTGNSGINGIINHIYNLFSNNVNFRQLGFVEQGIQVDPFDERPNEQFYTERMNIFFYIEGR